MFFQLSTFVVTSLAMLAAASPVELDVRGGSSSCGSGNNVYCCSSYQSASSASQVLGWLGIPVPSSESQVGFSCSPVTVGGTGTGANCVSQTSCCSGVYFVGYLVSHDPNKYLILVL
ncbi:hypothetical protein SCLCIDRAFT_1214360 [Scleroderma citrinum Foug A]|uniref:Hydrophobin n=1 Tax=Scleroderma citrinum Foug A TaxID=1036808 RepID=A0A0C3E5E7_9AGAM|nr:hypothetical protein SCLCIDRAFT_1214360 [Scleroderma citrinum Foug A]